MQINFWGGSTVESAKFSQEAKEWAVTVRRQDDGERLVLRPQHLVFATGMYGEPKVPTIEGADTFQGLQYHATQHRGGPHLKGKRCVVLGANTSGHDICATLWEHGADVTMVQRSPTLVLRSETFQSLYSRGLYNEAAGLTTDKGDLVSASVPFRIFPAVHAGLAQAAQAQDAELLARLEKVPTWMLPSVCHVYGIGFDYWIANKNIQGIVGLDWMWGALNLLSPTPRVTVLNA